MALFHWDETKSATNLEKHGIKFDEARLIFDGPVLSRIDSRRDYGELRFMTIGAINSLVVIVVVHTDRHGAIRIISARLANKRERRLYHEHIGKETGGSSGPK